jgi:hypothetical protein
MAWSLVVAGLHPGENNGRLFHDVSSAYRESQAAVRAERLAEELLGQPDDLSLMEKLNRAAQLLRTLPFEINLWKTQNICYKILQTHCPNFNEKTRLGDETAKELLRHYTVLADHFSLRVPICPINSKPANA